MSKQLGRYIIADEVRDELGRGAFGRVYRAFDPNVNKYVAIKVLSSGSDPDLRNRFHDESKTTGKLEHENIVRVYDFEVQDGIPYLVMELLEGETLETIIKERTIFGRPIRLLDKVEIMFQVAKGLQYAHAQGVVHRDIKPGNIMVLPNGTAKVMDFGIAIAVDKDGTRRTRQGDIAGTILYMAPEQFKGSDADKRTDLFSYAVVYYELLAGEHPFHANDPGSVMYRITAYDPPLIHQKVPECPEALDRIMQRLLSKDPDLRPEGVEDVIFDTQPIRQRLRHERAATLVSSIQLLIESGDLEGGQEAIRQVLLLDPGNAVARVLWEHLKNESRLKAIRARAKAQVQAGKDHTEARRFNEAVECFEHALALDKSDASIPGLLAEATLHVERVHSAARLVGEARTEIQQARLESAWEKVEKAVGLDSGNQEAAQLRDEVREQLRRSSEAATLARAGEHRGRGEFDEALALLLELETLAAAVLRGHVERERGEAERRGRLMRFQSALSKAREALHSQRLNEAAESAEALCAEYPEEPEAADLLYEVHEHLAAQRRMEAVGKVTQGASGLIQEERFEDAKEALEEGLRSYPGESKMHGMLQLVAALAAAQQRARKIGEVIEQTHSLAAAHRLDEALRAIERALTEFENDSTLVERKRDLEFERAHVQYAAGLQETLAQARRLVDKDRAGEAVKCLEEARFRYPGESDIAGLLASARLQEQDRRRRLAAAIGGIEEALQAGDWERAAASWRDAARDFPEHESLAAFQTRIQEGKRQAEINSLRTGIEDSLKRDDLEAVERQLTAARTAFSGEPVWQDLSREWQRRQNYRDKVALAEKAHGGKNYAGAEEILRALLPGAPDDSAARLLNQVAAERRAAEERAGREEEQRRRSESEEASRRRERAAIANGRAQAAALVQKEDYPRAIAALCQLAGQYPDNPEIQKDRDAAQGELERRQREAEEQARRQREQAIADGRGKAARMLKGDPQGAIALLERLSIQYPDSAEIHTDLDADRHQMERQRRQAQEQVRRRREQAIAKGRGEAGALLQKGDYRGAVALLDRLSVQYPDSADIRTDRTAAASEMERQRRQVEEQARQREEQERQRRQVEEQARQRQREEQARQVEERARQREQAIADGLAHAAGLLGNGDYEGAIAALDGLASQYPDRAEIQNHLEFARRKLDGQREQAVIAKGLAEAAALIQQDNCQAALTFLDLLDRQYPGNPEIRKDREAAWREMERRRREAEEKARSQRELAAIAKARSEAAALVSRGDCQGAAARLDSLVRQYPGNADIQQDREAAKQARERQIREAEDSANRALEASARRRRGAAKVSPQPLAEDAIGSGRIRPAAGQRVRGLAEFSAKKQKLAGRAVGKPRNETAKVTLIAGERPIGYQAAVIPAGQWRFSVSAAARFAGLAAKTALDEMPHWRNRPAAGAGLLAALAAAVIAVILLIGYFAFRR